MNSPEASIDSIVPGNDKLTIAPGTRLQLEIRGIEGRAESRLIGIEPGQFAIVAKPAAKSVVSGKLHKGITVTVRYLYQGVAYGFESRILGAIYEPVPLLFLGCPKIIAERNIRAGARIDCVLPCKLKLGDTDLRAVVVDLSRKGCRCVFMPDGGGSRQAKADDPLQAVIQIPGSANGISANAIVRSTEPDQGRASLGLEFDNLSGEQLNAIDAYIKAVTPAGPGNGNGA